MVRDGEREKAPDSIARRAAAGEWVTTPDLFQAAAKPIEAPCCSPVGAGELQLTPPAQEKRSLFSLSTWRAAFIYCNAFAVRRKSLSVCNCWCVARLIRQRGFSDRAFSEQAEVTSTCCWSRRMRSIIIITTHAICLAIFLGRPDTFLYQLASGIWSMLQGSHDGQIPDKMTLRCLLVNGVDAFWSGVWQ